MVSKTCIQMMGLQVNVFGLEEYKKLPSNTPVSVILGLHGKMNDQRQLERSCQALCGINEKRRSMDRYIICATFDGPNHGSRKVYNENINIKTTPLKEKYTFGMALYLYCVEVSRIVTQFMDVFELYAFGPNHKHPVEKWGAMCFSLGAHSVYMAIAKDPRITTFISMAGSINMIGLIRSYYKLFRAPEDQDIRTEYSAWSKTYRTDIVKRLKNVHLLAIYGADDKVVSSVNGERLSNILRKNHPGREHQDWKVLIVPGLDHYISKQSIAEAVQWTDRWMVRREPELTAKL